MKDFNYQFLWGIVCFSILMATLIVWRETWDGYNVSFVSAFLWQLAIWSIWLLFFRVMVWVVSRLNRDKRLLNKCLVALTSGALIAIHYVFYFLVSENFSPLRVYQRSITVFIHIFSFSMQRLTWFWYGASGRA